jgi:hypothetical protein
MLMANLKFSELYPLEQIGGGGSSSIANTTFQGDKSADFTSVANGSYQITGSCKMTLHSSPSVNDKVAFWLSSTANFDITSTDKFNGSLLATDYVRRVTQLYVIIVLTYSGSTNGWVWESRDNSYVSIAFTGTGYDFNYSSFGDINGIVYYLGATKHNSSFVNPVTRGELTLSASASFNGVNIPMLTTDRNTGNFWISGGGGGQWLRWKFNNGQTAAITSFTVRGEYALGNTRLEASTNGTTWNIISTFQIPSGDYYSGVFSNGVPYEYYRLFMTTAPAGNIFINELEFYGKLFF